MENPITSTFSPLIGIPCWGVERVHGSMLTFEFGSPHLIIRDPYISNSSLPKLQKLASRRRVRPVGEWQFLVFCCHWTVNDAGELLANDDGTDEEIEAAAHELDGQKLTGVMLDPVARTTIFSFDLGAVLKTWPYEDDSDEQWSLYRPSGDVLTYRADGMYSLHRDDHNLDRIVWNSQARRGSASQIVSCP